MAQMYLSKYKEYLTGKIDLSHAPDTYTRSNVGRNPKHDKGKVRNQPYITGYWYLAMLVPLAFLEDDDELRKKYVKYLNASAESFTPPSRNITKQEVIGYGGVKKFLATSQEISNSFSITFREHSNLEIFNILSHWATLINPFTGHHSKKYKGQCIVILAKPTFSGEKKLDKKDIEEIFFFDGVFPESQPIDKLDSNIESNETKTIDMTFSFDGSFMTKVFDHKSFLEDFNVIIEDFNPYEANDGSPEIITIDNNGA
jgi:hypothetical protein